MATTKNKLNTLKDFLIEQEEVNPEELQPATVENTYNENFNTFEIVGREYLVLTDTEADTEAAERIKQDLWAFRAEFILRHTKFYEDSTDRENKEFVHCLEDMQGRLCESANSIVKALIENIDDFIEDAINADGRGHFISWYGGEENEQEYNGEYYYIYRTN